MTEEDAIQKFMANGLPRAAAKMVVEHMKQFMTMEQIVANAEEQAAQQKAEAAAQKEPEAPATVEEDGTEGDFAYSIKGDTLTITGYNGSTTDITIPSKIKGQNVDEIGRRAFAQNNLTSVNLPEGLKVIAYGAFSKNKLVNVNIPASVAEICKGAFEDNELVSVSLPDGIKKVSEDAFQKNKIESLTLGVGITEIEEDAFAYNNLTTVNFPPKLEVIGYSSFSNNQLTSVIIPDSVHTIDRSVFRTNKIASLTLGSGVKTIGEDAFRSNKLEFIVIPDGVTTVGVKAFDTNNLLSVKIPDSLKTFGELAFGNAGVINSRGEVVLEGKADKDFAHILAPDGASYILTGIVKGAKNVNWAIIPHTIKGKPVSEIAAGAFKECGGGRGAEVKIPDSVHTIGDEAFAGLHLGNIVLGKNIVHIGKKAFADNSFNSVTIPNGVKTIPDEAFSGSHIKSLTVEGNLVSIGERAFFINSLDELTLPDSVKQIGKEAFAKNKIRRLKFPYTAALGKDVFAENITDEDGFTVQYAVDGKSIIITRADAKKVGALEEVVFPATFRGLAVSEIANKVFQYANIFTVPGNVHISGLGGGGGSYASVCKVTLGDNVTFDFDKFEYRIDHLAHQTASAVTDIVLDKKNPSGFDEFLVPPGSIKKGEYVPFYDVYKANGCKAGVMRLMIAVDMNWHETGKHKWVYSKGNAVSSQTQPQNQGNKASWVCACGVTNTNKFCGACGKPKPAGAPKYKCDKCGWEPKDMANVLKFCPDCGDPLGDEDIVK